jgi:hypothetical protein
MVTSCDTISASTSPSAVSAPITTPSTPSSLAMAISFAMISISSSV